MSRIRVEDRRRALVEATVRVIARDGVAAATTRAVVAEAGMSLASLHYAFPSRDHLMDAVIAEVTDQERRAAADGLLPVADLPDGGTLTLEGVLRAGLDGYIDLLIADPAHEQALLELALYAMRTYGHRAALVAQYDVYRRSAAASLAFAARITGSRWTVPLDDVARALVLVTDGLTTGWLADRDTPAARRSAAFAARSIAALGEPDASSSPGDADPAGGADRPHRSATRRLHDQRQPVPVVRGPGPGGRRAVRGAGPALTRARRAPVPRGPAR